MTQTVFERFAAKVAIQKNGCHLWLTHVRSDGYGQFWFNNRSVLAHRFAYEQTKGVVPAGLQLDHLCRVRSCVNPDHLEAVTSRENSLRGQTIAAANAAKTACPRGHEYDKANTRYLSSGSRLCRECHRDESREYQRQRRAQMRQAVTA